MENQSEIHPSLLLYKAKALGKLGVPSGARETLTSALRRKKDRSRELLQALRYERALVYEERGWEKRYRKTLEMLYAVSPDQYPSRPRRQTEKNLRSECPNR